MKNNQKGFTLIELILSMAIIGILATFMVVNFKKSGVRSRDTQRINDLNQYTEALELYANNHNGVYPEKRLPFFKAEDLCTDLGISDCPVDPKDNTNSCLGALCGYYYQSNGDAIGFDYYAGGTRYTIRARVEETPNVVFSCAAGETASDPKFYVICSDRKQGYACNNTGFSTGTCPTLY
ncbi:hypothetical protein A2Z22_00220 [Candidatus Woesebacteria bacterium RBG_16_34_12]|uniref:Type II secretion system protein GspG C-terminal domain-containing protein n=1 Tax=Candidatus Woesebacteria bacterium RBG_16_34_12 TaxID=1802480 RepID=A0A1F7X8X4_9BACT|nr:MAG: hypothetical protein A2Z22_00220 [Candidatus Woesebacteria bacterium RBG_16_34_12]